MKALCCNPLRSVGSLHRSKEDNLFALFLFLFALLPRLYVALRWGEEPIWDGHYYDFGARRIAAGLGYSDEISIAGQSIWHPWCHYPVGYSAFLGFFYWLLGTHAWVACCLNACVGAANSVAVWLLARHALSPARAKAAGFFVACHPGLILYSALRMTELLAALLTLLSFWILVRTKRYGFGFVPASFVLGLAGLVRPQALLCAPFFAIAAPVRSPHNRFLCISLHALLACILVLVPILPWTLRNCRIMDGCALVSTNGGWNLAIGSFPRATGRFEILRTADGCREVTGQVQQDRCWFSYGLAHIRTKPMRWIALIPAKLGFTFNHESFAVEYLHEADPAFWSESKRLAMRAIATLAHQIVVCAAAFACIRRSPLSKMRTQGVLWFMVLSLIYAIFSQREPPFWSLVLFVAIVPWFPLSGSPAWPPALLLLVALIGTTMLTHAVFFGEDRYHIVVTPALCMLAASALRRGDKPLDATGLSSERNKEKEPSP